VKKQTYYIAIGAMAAAIGAFAITNQSFWIDEGGAAIHATQPTLPDWWQSLRLEGNSNLQLILQQLYLWGWEKIFGSSEIALRASNIPWFVAAVLALAWAFPDKRCLQNGVIAVTLSNAFLWYYLSEARPYIVLFAFSALTAACLFRAVAISREPVQSAAHFRLFCFGVVGMCATSLIAVPWAMAATVAFATSIGLKRLRETVRKYPLTALSFVGALAGLGLFYLWTLTLGARASDVGRTSLASIGFIFYELLGLAGLGPGRLALRNENFTAHIAYLPFAILGVVAIVSLCVGAFRLRWNVIDKKQLLFFVIITSAPFVLVLGAGVGGHVRLLGRHLVPFLPFVLIVLGAGVCRLLSSQSKVARAIALGAIGVLVLSALEIRFAPRHQRDDYRTAAAEARRALVDGKKVWWAADASTAAYYGVPLNSSDLTLSSNLSGRSFATHSPPDLVCLSKRDIYDSTGKIDKYLREHDFRVTQVLPAFQIFERPPVPH
jgi:hypothetical protein